jgi:hypothetical protein
MAARGFHEYPRVVNFILCATHHARSWGTLLV